MELLEYILTGIAILALGIAIYALTKMGQSRKEKLTDDLYIYNAKTLESLMQFLRVQSGITGFDFKQTTDKNSPPDAKEHRVYIVKEEDYKRFEDQKANILAAEESIYQAYENAEKAKLILGDETVKPHRIR